MSENNDDLRQAVYNLPMLALALGIVFGILASVGGTAPPAPMFAAAGGSVVIVHLLLYKRMDDEGEDEHYCPECGAEHIPEHDE